VDIYYDGINLSQIDKDQLYDIVAFVPQESILLNDTIENNIKLDHNCSDEYLKKILEITNLDSLITRLPEGLNTNCGERGLKLSGGERQRISLARSLVRKPKYLFLDEVSSALDEETENNIFESLRKIAKKQQ
jgi:ABC-type multidrug transport system fused ATPase/permease subunit